MTIEKDAQAEEEVTFEPVVPADDELVVTDSQEAEIDVKKAVNAIDAANGREPKYQVDEPQDPDVQAVRATLDILESSTETSVSDGSTAAYYQLPEGAKELQDLISFKNMNAQMGEIGRAWYRYGEVAHSEKMRDAKKIKFYIEAEIKRLETYGE